VAKDSKLSRFRPVEIGNVGGNRTIIQTTEAKLTAFGGIPMLAFVERKLGLVKMLAERVNDKRFQARVDHKRNDIILQRVIQIGAGFPDGNDCDWLARDEAVLLGLDRNPMEGKPGASQETTSRFESNAIDEKNQDDVNNIFVDHYIAQQKKRPKLIELDLDGTMIKTYGAQQGSVYRGGKYKHTMYFPLMIFSGDWLLGAILRRGDQSEAGTVLDELKKVVSKLRARWPGVRIKVRLDAAFCSGGLVQWLKKNRIAYEIALRSTSVLELYSKAFAEEAQSKFVDTFGEPLFTGDGAGRKIHAEHARIRGLPKEERMKAEEESKRRRKRVVGEFCYKPEKWKFLKWQEWERVICRCDFTDKGLEVKYVLVSDQKGIPQKIYEDEYCKRGLAEQFIETFKQAGHRLSAQEFKSNQFRLILSGIVYMLMKHLRHYVSPKLRAADAETLRKTLMIMPMIIRQAGKKVILEISESHAHRWEFLDTWRRLTAT